MCTLSMMHNNLITFNLEFLSQISRNTNNLIDSCLVLKSKSNKEADDYYSNNNWHAVVKQIFFGIQHLTIGIHPFSDHSSHTSFLNAIDSIGAIVLLLEGERERSSVFFLYLLLAPICDLAP